MAEEVSDQNETWHGVLANVKVGTVVASEVVICMHHSLQHESCLLAVKSFGFAMHSQLQDWKVMK